MRGAYRGVAPLGFLRRKDEDAVMSVARIASRAQLGLHAPLVHVEVHLGTGLPAFTIVGLAATGSEGEQGARAGGARRTRGSSFRRDASR